MKQLFTSLKPFTLPITLATGFFVPSAAELYPLTKWLLGTMLFFSLVSERHALGKDDYKKIVVVFAFNMLLGPLYALLVSPIDKELSIGLLLVGMAPTATAAVAVVALSGGRPVFVMAAIVVTHLGASIWIPMYIHIFSGFMAKSCIIGTNVDAFNVLKGVAPLLIIPWLLSGTLRFLPEESRKNIRKLKSYILPVWGLAIFLIGARTRELWNGMEQDVTVKLLLIVFSVLVVCAIQFKLGAFIGKKSSVETAQSLGQKNTVLMVWIALNWLGPIYAVAPLSYILWQNVFISFRLRQISNASTNSKMR